MSNIAAEPTSRRIHLRNYIDRLTGHVLCADCGADTLQWSGGETSKGRGCLCLTCGGHGNTIANGALGEVMKWCTTPAGARIADGRWRAADLAQERVDCRPPF